MRSVRLEQFLDEVIIPVLKDLGMNSKSAQVLMLGTAMCESNLTFFNQIGGPAQSFYGIEPETYEDIRHRYLSRRTDIAEKLEKWCVPALSELDQLDGNMYLSTAFARIKYWMDPNPLPPAGRPLDLYHVYKQVYNTHLGASDIDRCGPLFVKAAGVVLGENYERT